MQDLNQVKLQEYDNIRGQFPTELQKLFYKLDNYLKNQKKLKSYQTCLKIFRHPDSDFNIQIGNIPDLKFGFFTNSYSLNENFSFQNVNTIGNLNDILNIQEGTTILSLGISIHYNLMVIRKEKDQIYTLYIEPYGDYFLNCQYYIDYMIENANSYYQVYEKLKTNRINIFDFFDALQVSDISRINLYFRQAKVVKQQTELFSEEIYQNLKMINEFEQYVKIQNVVKLEIQNFISNHFSKVKHFQDPNIILQHNDSLGFCESTKLVVMIIESLLQECLLEQQFCNMKFKKNQYMDTLIMILLELNNTEFYFDTENSPICGQGGFLCFFNMIAFIHYNMNYQYVEEDSFNYMVKKVLDNDKFEIKESRQQVIDYCNLLKTDLNLQKMASQVINVIKYHIRKILQFSFKYY